MFDCSAVGDKSSALAASQRDINDIVTGMARQWRWSKDVGLLKGDGNDLICGDCPNERLTIKSNFIGPNDRHS